MASQIILNRGTLEQKKETLQAAVTELKNSASELEELKKSTVSAGIWEGEARDAYEKNMTDGLGRINELISVIQQFIDKVEETLAAYEAVERSNVNLVM